MVGVHEGGPLGMEYNTLLIMRNNCSSWAWDTLSKRPVAHETGLDTSKSNWKLKTCTHYALQHILWYIIMYVAVHLHTWIHISFHPTREVYAVGPSAPRTPTTMSKGLPLMRRVHLLSPCSHLQHCQIPFFWDPVMPLVYHLLSNTLTGKSLFGFLFGTRKNICLKWMQRWGVDCQIRLSEGSAGKSSILFVFMTMKLQSDARGRHLCPMASHWGLNFKKVGIDPVI